MPIRKSLTSCLVASALMLASAAHAASHLRGIKIAITNPSGEERKAESIVISIPELRKVAPELRAGSLIVTVTHTSDLQQDAAAMQAAEVPSQVDDLDGDGKADELAFQLNLKAHETCIVTVTYGDPERIFKIRSDYPAGTDAFFAKRFEGLGWESEKNAWRIYFDPRNAIDLYGKRRSTLMLKRFATAEYDYHADSADGRDIYRIGDALGIGSVGAWREGKLIKVSDVRARSYRIISTGPVRAIAELTYESWNAGGIPVTLRMRITQWAGDRGFFQTLTADAPPGFIFATGLPLKGEAPALHSANGRSWIGTWGEQVVMPGATATEPVHGSDLGVGIVMITPSMATAADDQQNHLLTFPREHNSASWYTFAAWDQEGINDRTDLINNQEMRERSWLVTPHAGIRTKNQFAETMQRIAESVDHPAQVRIMPSAANPQSAPPDTLKLAPRKTYSQAISLLSQEINRTATKWEPVITASDPATMATNRGLGFFTDGDNQTGEWKQRQGFYWTGSFWVGELWKMYSSTHDEKYRRWAELWNSRLLGLESQQNHDAGFLYYYSSVLGFQQTGSPRLKESAMIAAQRLSQLFNSRTQLIAAWDVNGDDSIVDTMMNLQILWWASEQTADPKWRELGLEHARRTADWLVRSDGSVIQSVHYDPGDGRKRLELHGGTLRDVSVELSNDSSSGDMLFTHTHQGLSAGTTWSRGAGWALYGFSRAYAATHETKLLAVSQRIADYVINNLPEDGVPWFDFDDEGVHYRNRDSSAAAIIAGGLLNLSQQVPDKNQATIYREQSRRIVQSLIDHYLTPVGDTDPTPPGVLRHGCSTRPADGMLIYGQYYLLETLLALQQEEKRLAQGTGGVQ